MDDIRTMMIKFQLSLFHLTIFKAFLVTHLLFLDTIGLKDTSFSLFPPTKEQLIFAAKENKQTGSIQYSFLRFLLFWGEGRSPKPYEKLFPEKNPSPPHFFL